MRTYKMILEYEGTRFQGWQRQANTKMTIQEMIENAISETTGFPVEIDGSGRTDAGVHALGQTASFVLPGKICEEGFRKSLNEKLPEDIRVRSLSLVKNGFHARYQAVGKSYEYLIDTREKAEVFHRKYACHFPKPLNIEKMKAAAKLLEGQHDFAAFTDKKEEKSTVRKISGITMIKESHFLRIVYTGNGFMYHMVRILTGTLLEVGTGERAISEVVSLLKSKKRSDAGFLAPACGLKLKEVYY